MFTVSALTGIGLFVVIVLLLHFVEPEFDPSRRFVSEYALGDQGYLMNLAFFMLSAGNGTLAIQLRHSQDREHDFPSGLLITASIFVMIAGAINPDPSTEGSPTTVLGVVHTTSVVIAMCSVLVSAFIIARQFGRDSRWQSLDSILKWWAIIMLSTMVLHLATAETHLAGSFQRLYLAVVVGWLLYMIKLLWVMDRRS